MRGLLELITTKALGNKVHKVPPKDWPDSLRESGFDGTAIYMDEPVLDTKSVVKALAGPFRDSIRKINWPDGVRFEQDDKGNIKSITLNEETRIYCKEVVFTAAESNDRIARILNHDDGLEVQRRPLLMAMMKNAPYPLHAHCVGASEKPVMTITTHKNLDGTLIWYLGGSVAEKPKEADPETVYAEARKVIQKYLPGTNLENVQWAPLPIDRVEGAKSNHGKLPDAPVLHSHGNALYAWPTKLTFAPQLSDMVVDHLKQRDVNPGAQKTDWSRLPKAYLTTEPWNEPVWQTSQNTKDPSEQRG